MKTLKDGTQVSGRSYYYLLDFNNREECETIIKLSSQNKLDELNLTQYVELFYIATLRELTEWNKELNLKLL